MIATAWRGLGWRTDDVLVFVEGFFERIGFKKVADGDDKIWKEWLWVVG